MMDDGWWTVDEFNPQPSTFNPQPSTLNHEDLHSPSLYDLWTKCEGKFPSFGKVGDEGARISSVA